MGEVCRVCGKSTDTRGGLCFDCASAAERKAAGRTVEEHLRAGLEAMQAEAFEVARVYFSWALERLTDTGDYAPGGTFGAEYPGWREDKSDSHSSANKSS